MDVCIPPNPPRFPVGRLLSFAVERANFAFGLISVLKNRHIMSNTYYQEEEEEEEEEGERRARRRLGLSGGPDWLYARTHGAMWILHFFGGFFNPYGCWVTGRSGERPSVPALPPTNRRATDRNGEAVKCHRTEAEADAAQAQAQHSAR